MNGLEAFDDRLAALIANLSPAARKEMARNIAKRLRASLQQDIKRQQRPDGTPFKPRKAQPARKKKGRVKREMFKKAAHRKVHEGKSRCRRRRGGIYRQRSTHGPYASLRAARPASPWEERSAV